MYYYDYVNNEDELYRKAINLRYDIFFKPYGCSEDVTIDSLEESAFHLVCYNSNKELVGYGRLNIKNKVGQISQLIVDLSYRSKGIASNIIEKLEIRCKELDVDKIFLNAKVEAIGLYKSNGYKIAGEEFLSSKTKIPHIKMKKFIM